MKLYFCGKYKDEEQRKNYKKIGNNPLFGYNWWQWLPTLRRQNLDNKLVPVLTWLNFWVEFDNA